MGQRVRWHRRAAVIALALAAAAVGLRPPAEARGSAAERAEVLARARALGAKEAWLGPLLAAPGALSRTGRGFENVAAQADAPSVRLPERASGAIDLRLGRWTRPLASIHHLGAADSPGELASGHLIYPAIAPATDAIWTVRGEVVEQLLLLADASAPRHFSWSVSLREDLSVRRETGGALLFEDGRGRPRLRLPVPFAVDREGRRFELSMTFSVAKSALEIGFGLPAEADRFPLLVDPALEEVLWVDKTPAVGQPTPGRRARHALAHHEKLGKTLLFGGAKLDAWGDVTQLYGDSWTWDGSTWELLPAGGPGARQLHAMVYDAAHEQIVLFGGADQSFTQYSAETWIWNGSWSQVTTPQPIGGLSRHAMAYDRAQGVVLLYGGFGDSGTADQLWQWNGSSWKDVTPPSGLAPGVYRDSAMAFASGNQVLLFGGETTVNGLDSLLTNDNWTFAAGGWSKQAASPPWPAPRYRAALAHDVAKDRTLLFGGGDYADWYADTWEWDGQAWTERTPLTFPPKRELSALAYDTQRQRMVLFSGDAPTLPDTVADTWEYFRLGGACATGAECEGKWCVDGVCCQVQSCGTCQKCGAAQGTCEPVVGDDDTCDGAMTCDAAGQCKKKNGEACSAAGECASGHCADGFCCSAACTGSCEACDVAGSEGSCSLVSGAARHGSCPGSGVCGSSCDGSSAECVYPAAGSDCGSSCDQAVLTRRACDGSGACVQEAPAVCAGSFGCADAASCAKSCDASLPCAAGAVCEDGACVAPRGQCVGEATARLPDGTEQDCGAYRCENGQCAQVCSSIDDCVAGNACTPEGACVPADDAPSDDAGCGCRLAPRSSIAEIWSVLGLVLLLRRRRSR